MIKLKYSKTAKERTQLTDKAAKVLSEHLNPEELGRLYLDLDNLHLDLLNSLVIKVMKHFPEEFGSNFVASVSKPVLTDAETKILRRNDHEWRRHPPSQL